MYKRFHELDSLRGLAALTVVFSHFMLVYNVNFIDTQGIDLSFNWYKYSPLHIFWAGGEAVILFFILSGFVLFLPFSKKGLFSYKNYITKRVFRIYPASIVAILVALLLFIVSLGNLKLIDSQWIQTMWTSDITIQGIISDILLLGYGGQDLNPVLWSLVHEIRLSFLFPIIAFVIMKYDWKKVITLSLALSLLGYVLMMIFNASTSSLAATLYYSGTFVVGAILSKHRSILIEKVTSIHISGKLLIFILAITFYILGWIVNNKLVIHNNFTRDWATIIGAAMIIILSLSSSRISKILKFNVVQFFGKISYSLYLYHLIFLIFFTKFNLDLSIPVTLLLTFVVSVIAATISYNFIEKPAINIGRKLTKKS